MQSWEDEAIMLGARPYSEDDYIVTLWTSKAGMHRAMLRRSKRSASILQPGNIVTASWVGRLESHLGRFRLSPLDLVSCRMIAAPYKLPLLQSLCSVLMFGAAEKQPYPVLYNACRDFIYSLEKGGEEDGVKHYILLELEMLAQFGFGMELGACAVTGARRDLLYVSPRTGRAVSCDVGREYADKLLYLPRFVAHAYGASHYEDEKSAERDITSGLALTRYFLDKHIADLRGRPLPHCRTALEEILNIKQSRGRICA